MSAEAAVQMHGSPDDAREPARPAGGAWRAIGIGALGMLGGVFAATLIPDALGIAYVLLGGEFPIEVAVVLGSFLPVIAVAGAVVALLVDRRVRARRGSGGAAIAPHPPAPGSPGGTYSSDV